MERSRRLLVTASTVAACAIGLSVSGAASADGDGRDVLRSGLVGSTPPGDGGPRLFGADPGGAPWVTAPHSSVRVRDDGRVDVTIRGLVIPDGNGGGTNPVARVTVSVVCNGAPVAGSPRTREFPMDEAGNARVRDSVRLPEPCLAPAVLVHPAAAGQARYIAADGG